MTTHTPRLSWTVRNAALTLLLLFAIVPAVLVGWLLYDSNIQTADRLSQKSSMILFSACSPMLKCSCKRPTSFSTV